MTIYVYQKFLSQNKLLYQMRLVVNSLQIKKKTTVIDVQSDAQFFNNVKLRVQKNSENPNLVKLFLFFTTTETTVVGSFYNSSSN